MRRAGHKRTLSARATPVTPSVTVRNAVAIADAPTSNTPVDVELLPTVKTIVPSRPDDSDDREARAARFRALEIAVRQRIETRLSGRVKNLVVRAFDGVVVLEGQCATYYTKQLAQHTAMGILEDEHLENAIVVSMQ